MNEDHIIAAILAAGILAQNREGVITAAEAVEVYGKCLSELLDSTRAPRPANKD